MKKSAIRARIRQLCGLGVPGELLLGPLLPALRELVPGDFAGFFWVDARGEIRNLYAERLVPIGLSPGRGAVCAVVSRPIFRRAFVACAESSDGIAALDIGEGHHVLGALVRGESAALGQLCIYRSATHAPFGDVERADLASVMRYVAPGVARRFPLPAGDPLAFAYEDCEEEAMLVADALGTILFASEHALRLLLLATSRRITPASWSSPMGEGTARAIKALCARPTITLDSPWGRFVLRAYRLSDGRGREARIGLRIQRQMPMILRFVSAMGRQGLSPRQREIALQVALGRTNLEISRRMGLSLNTVSYHLKQLFLRLDVHTRAEAVEKIAWGERAVPA